MEPVGVYFWVNGPKTPGKRGFSVNFRANHRVKSARLWGVARPAAQCAGGMRQHTWVLGNLWRMRLLSWARPLTAYRFENVLTAYTRSRNCLFGMKCKAWRAAHSLAMSKRRNAAITRKGSCPSGWGEIGRLGAPVACMGMDPCGDNRATHSSRLHPNATSYRPSTRSKGRSRGAVNAFSTHPAG